jgi:hypothetical protein
MLKQFLPGAGKFEPTGMSGLKIPFPGGNLPWCTGVEGHKKGSLWKGAFLAWKKLMYRLSGAWIGKQGRRVSGHPHPCHG